jgi:hypothetical protein
VKRWCLVLAGLGFVGTTSCLICPPRTSLPPLPEGCEPPTLLANATITLRQEGGACTATVKPRHLCVQQRGVVRWYVDNECGPLEGRAGRPALRVTGLTPTQKDRGRAGWLEKACSASLQRVEKGSPLREVRTEAPPEANVIVCSVPDDPSLVGQYKYNLEGEIVPLDPHLEVIQPRGPP